MYYYILILFSIQVSSKTLTVAPFGNNEVADYYASGTDDQHTIQRAICDLKGNLTTYFDSGNQDKTCGYQSSIPDVDPIIYSNGGTIKLLAGTFYISGQIHLYSNMILEGAGIDITYLILDNNSPPFDNSGIIRFASNQDSASMTYPVVVRNLVLRDFTINGNKNSNIFDGNDPYHSGRYGIYTLYSSNIHMERLRVINCQGYGFDPHGVPGEALPTTFMTIKDCYSENNNLDGFTIDKSENVVVTNNYAINNARHGFELTTGTYGIQFTDNHAINNGHYYFSTGDNKIVFGCGIRAQDQLNAGVRWGSKRGIFSNNYVENSADYGFCLSELDQLVVSNNIVVNSGEGCMRLMDSDESFIGVNFSAVTSNLCINNNRGIVVQQSHQNVIVSNIITVNDPNNQWGIELEDSTYNVIHSNNILNTKGIDMSNSPNNDIIETLIDAPLPSSGTGNCCYWTSCVQESQESCQSNGGGWLGTTQCNNITCPSTPPDIPPPLQIMSVKSVTLEEANGYRIIKTFKNNGDFLAIDIRDFVAFSQLIPGTAIRIVFELEDTDFYPERFEYTSDNTNNDKGIIFDISTNDLIGASNWVIGFNTVEHIVQNDDYVAVADVINYSNMDRLQLYWTESQPITPPNVDVTIHEIKIGNPLDF